MSVPSDLPGLVIFVLVVFPGLVFQGVRTAVGGERLGAGQVALRTVEAIVVGVSLWLCYGLLLGPELQGVAQDPVRSPRLVSLLGLAGLVIIPAALGTAREHRHLSLSRRRPFVTRASGFTSVPTAWDAAAPYRTGWVRIRLATGDWVGGWIGSAGYVSTYPEARDVFIDHQWRLTKDGAFESVVENGDGIWVGVPTGSIVEWIASPEFESTNREDHSE